MQGGKASLLPGIQIGPIFCQQGYQRVTGNSTGRMNRSYFKGIGGRYIHIGALLHEIPGDRFLAEEAADADREDPSPEGRSDPCGACASPCLTAFRTSRQAASTRDMGRLE